MKKFILPALVILSTLVSCSNDTSNPKSIGSGDTKIVQVDLGPVFVNIHANYSEQFLKYPTYTWAVTKWTADNGIVGGDNIKPQFDNTTKKFLPDVVNLGWKNNVHFEVVSYSKPNN